MASPPSLIEACFSVPAVRALRNARPSASLTLLSPESIAPLWRTLPDLNHIVEYPDDASARAIARILTDSNLNLETSLAWEASDAASALARARVPQRLGYDGKRLNKKLTDSIHADLQPGPAQHRVRFYMGLIQQLGIECYVPENFATPPLPARPNPARVGLVPGSTLGDAYRWDLARFLELGRALLAHHQIELVILAYPGQSEAANELEAQFGGDVRNFGREFDLAGLLNALAHCSFLIANDDAVTHLAAHLGLPAVALFGPGDPVATRPLGRQHMVLSQHLECSPCNQARCPLGHHNCMEELTVARVLETVSSFLPPRPEATVAG